MVCQWLSYNIQVDFSDVSSYCNHNIQTAHMYIVPVGLMCAVDTGGFRETAYVVSLDISISLSENLSVSEGDVVRVCAVVSSPAVRCPADFSFRLLLTTRDIDDSDSASKVM